MQFNTSEARFEQAQLHRQPRFGYGPLLGVLFANILSNSALARYPPLGSLRVTYDPIPWLPYNRPSDNSYHHDYWHPIKNAYGPPSPSTSTETDSHHIHHHHHINPFPNQQQIVNINESPPTEIIIDDDDDDMTSDKERHINGDDAIYSNVLEAPDVKIENPHIVEPIAQESVQLTVSSITDDNIATTLTPKYHVKRGAGRYASIKRKASGQEKRRFTTSDYYYDSYEDTTRYKLNKKTKPRRPLDSFEDNDEYEYDSFEFTTRPSKKRRPTTVRPKRNRNKNKNRRKQQKVTTPVYDDDYDYDRVEPITQIVVLRARDPPTTTEETMITNGTTTSATTTTTETTSTTTKSTNATGYGYGPSNGNENISFTYGPPQGEPQGEPQGAYGPPRPSYGPPRPAYGLPSSGQYQIPYSDWYSNDGTRNTIVKKVHDIIGFDHIF